MKDIVIFGAGGLGREVYDIIMRINNQKIEYNVLGFIDEKTELKSMEINGKKVLGGDEIAIELSGERPLYGALALSSWQLRKKIVNKMKDHIIWENIIDPSACISHTALVGMGNIIQYNVFVSSKVKIGDFCILNVGSVIGHDTNVDDYVSIMPCCNVTGNVSLEKCTYLGGNVCVIPGINIAEKCVIGAGAVVVKDLVETGTYVGVPAKLNQ